MKKKQKQYTDLQANVSSLVTKLRWIVEALNGQLKFFKYLAVPVNIRANMEFNFQDQTYNTIESVAEITASLYNEHRGPYIKPNSNTKLNNEARLIKSREKDTNDILEEEWVAIGWHEATDGLKNPFFDGIFPKFNVTQLIQYNGGSWSVNKASRYLAHSRGFLKFWYNESYPYSIKMTGMQSSYQRRGNKKNNRTVIIRFEDSANDINLDNPLTGTESMCACRNGQRKTRNCSHRNAALVLISLYVNKIPFYVPDSPMYVRFDSVIDCVNEQIPEDFEYWSLSSDNSKDSDSEGSDNNSETNCNYHNPTSSSADASDTSSDESDTKDTDNDTNDNEMPLIEKINVYDFTFVPNNAHLYNDTILQRFVNWSEWNMTKNGCGTYNIQNGCYYNAIIKCLTFIPVFYQLVSIYANIYFQRFKQQPSCHSNHGPFCPLQTTIAFMRKIFNEPTRFNCRSSELHNNISAINESFEVGSQQDAHEFLVSLLNKIAKCDNINYYQRNRLKHRATKRTNVINKIFGTYIQSTVTCHKCKQKSSKFDALTQFEVQISHQTLNACLNSYFKSEKLENINGTDNRYQCNHCNCKTNATRRIIIHGSPNVLVIVLKWFDENNRKIDKQLSFPINLNISKYCSSLQSGQDSQALYQLASVTVHRGNSANSGHYTAFTKAPNGQWWNTNDSKCSKVKVETVRKCLTRDNGKQHHEPYILFYVRREVNDSIQFGMDRAQITQYMDLSSCCVCNERIDASSIKCDNQHCPFRICLQCSSNHRRCSSCLQYFDYSLW